MVVQRLSVAVLALIGASIALSSVAATPVPGARLPLDPAEAGPGVDPGTRLGAVPEPPSRDQHREPSSRWRPSLVEETTLEASPSRPAIEGIGSDWIRPEHGQRAGRSQAPASTPVPGSSTTPVTAMSTGLAALAAGLLYHRIGRSEVLENPLRRRIYETVIDEPGGTTTDYAEKVDADRTTARYHLDMLARCDLVVAERLRGHRRFFENHGRYDARTRRVVAHLRNGTTREMIRTLLEEPELTYAELGRRVGISKSATYRKVEQLQDLDVVDVDDARTPATVEAAEVVDEVRDWLVDRDAEAPNRASQ